MIPSIILNKIDWYLWRIKQRELCKEYHTITKFHNTYLRFDDHIYNYRNMLISWKKKFICIFDKKSKSVGKLPYNYIYTNG